MTRQVQPGGFGFERPHEGKSNDWLTPPELVRRLGPFDLDPCGYPGHKLATTTYTPTLKKDGLVLPWFGRVFCNPPYGPHVRQWVERMAEHANGILLIFSRTETRTWRNVWRSGDAFFFPLSRIAFLRPDGRKAGSGTAPSVLVAYGAANVDALRNCGLAGALITHLQLLDGIRASSLGHKDEARARLSAINNWLHKR